jgi:hypothetical protein
MSEETAEADNINVLHQFASYDHHIDMVTFGAPGQPQVELLSARVVLVARMILSEKSPLFRDDVVAKDHALNAAMFNLAKELEIPESEFLRLGIRKPGSVKAA